MSQSARNDAIIYKMNEVIDYINRNNEISILNSLTGLIEELNKNKQELEQALEIARYANTYDTNHTEFHVRTNQNNSSSPDSSYADNSLTKRTSKLNSSFDEFNAENIDNAMFQNEDNSFGNDVRDPNLNR
jgi:preprotein translocase subunit SecA